MSLNLLNLQNMMDNNKISELTRKISEGVDKAFAKLVRQKALVDGYLIFSDDNGKIFRVKAKDLLSKLKD